MNDPIIAINKIDSLLSEWNNNRELSAAYFAASKAILSELNDVAEENKLTGYTHEKLGNVNFHINAMFGCDIDNGHDFSAHYSWALGDIGNLTTAQCFGSLNRD